MRGSLLGPQFSAAEIQDALDIAGAKYVRLEESEPAREGCRGTEPGRSGRMVSGIMEFGPRALGARSILGDARNPKMQSQMNLKIKYRESFRPFAPVVLADKAGDYFEIDRPSPYMLLVANVRGELRHQMSEYERGLFGIEKLNVPRSTIPAVTHVDYSARIQTVDRAANSRLYGLLERFEALTGCAVLVNTSFNVRGEPIVCSPADAYRCFMRTNMDYLVIEDFLLAKSEQPQRPDDDSWKNQMERD